MPPNNPKRSDPHMRIAHSVFEAIYRSKLSILDAQVFMLLLRRSWGFNKKTVCISSEAIGEEIGVFASNARRTLGRLVKFKMISVTVAAKRNKPATYRPNKLYWNWTVYPGPMAYQNQPNSVSLEIRQESNFDTPSEKIDPDLSHMASGQSGNRRKPPKENYKERSKETPLPQRGDRGGYSVSDYSSEDIEAAKKTLYKVTGRYPDAKDFARVRSVTLLATPPNWVPSAWHRHCQLVMGQLLRKVTNEWKDGKDIGCIYAVSCTRAKKQLLTDALHPEEFEGEYDESA